MKKKIILIIVAITILYIISSIYMIFEGTPWGKLQARREIKEYLNTVYGEKMAIKKIFYIIYPGTYGAECYVIENPEIKFVVLYDISEPNELVDTYAGSKMSYDITKKINELIKMDKTSIRAVLQNTSDLELEHKYEIPDAFSFIDKLEVAIFVEFEYEYSESDKEEETIFEIIYKLNELEEKLMYKAIYFDYENIEYVLKNSKIIEIKTPSDVTEHIIEIPK